MPYRLIPPSAEGRLIHRVEARRFVTIRADVRDPEAVERAWEASGAGA